MINLFRFKTRRKNLFALWLPGLLALPLASFAAETNYVQQIPGTTVTFEMVAIPGGTLTKTKPGGETEKISIAPFWMEKYEVKWEEYLLWVFGDREQFEKEKLDGITHPTKPYGSVYRERGENGYPTIA